MEHILTGSAFELRLSVRVFEADLQYSTNALMDVNVHSDGYSGHATMDIDIKALASFSDDLCLIYANLSGEARIAEPYGQQMHIAFHGDGKGHIMVSGQLRHLDQSLIFSGVVDQTQIRDFCRELQTAYSQYTASH